jgi:dihydropteroate synthase
LHRLHDVARLGHPVVIGASRKSFLRPFIDADGTDPGPHQLDGANAAVSALAAGAGVYCVRVHDVTSSVAAAWSTGSAIGS